MVVVLKSWAKRFIGIHQVRYHALALISHRLHGSPVPPPHTVKLYWLNHFRRSYSLSTLVETGTHYGTTVVAMLNQFEQIYTIELDYNLWERAHDRFLRYPHVHAIHGNSGEVLSEVLASITGCCLFWLDGHFSGCGTARGSTDTPIREELAAIRSHNRKDHIILIDDARLFDGLSDFPSLNDVFWMLGDINPDYRIKVVDDIIQACPPKRHRLKSWAW